MTSEIEKQIQRIYKKIDKLAVKGKDSQFEYFALVDEFIDRGDFDNFRQTLYYRYDIDTTTYFENIPRLKSKTWKAILFNTNSPIQSKIKKLFDSRKVYQQGYDIWSDAITTLSFSMSSPLSSNYSITSSTQSIVPSRIGDKVYFTINDPKIYSMEIIKCEWVFINGHEQPLGKSIEMFQSINTLATQSTYQTEISVNNGRQYLVKSYSQNENIDFTKLNYKLIITKNSFLGQIKEYDIYQQNPSYFSEDAGLAKFKGLKKTFLEVTKPSATMSLYVTYDSNQKEDLNLVKRYEIALNYLLS